MSRRLSFVITVFLCLPFPGMSQENGSGLNYQMTVINNPGVAGSEGDGTLRLSYLNYYPGNNYNLHSVLVSYDGYFPGIHGGAMAYISDNYLGGVINDIKGGFAYSYFLRAGKKLYISAGLSASLYNRGFRTGNVVLPDQIDPLGGTGLPSDETLASRGRTVPDIGTGIFFMADHLCGGIAINHLAEPAISDEGPAPKKLKRSLLLHAAGIFPVGPQEKLRICPVASIETGNGITSAGAGTSFESRYIAVNTVFFAGNNRNLDLQAGITASAGNIEVFYNYRFNLFSGNSMLPFSLLHHTGLAFRLNNVDKRKTVKTINFPKL